MDVVGTCPFVLNRLRNPALSRHLRRSDYSREMSRLADALWTVSFALTKPKEPFDPFMGEESTIWYKTVQFADGMSDAKRIVHWLDLDMTRPALCSPMARDGVMLARDDGVMLIVTDEMAGYDPSHHL